jgi:vacuolar-type H+-ATPase subunit I/STV1
MSFKEELKRTALSSVIKPLGWIFAFVGAVLGIFGGLDVINGFSILELITSLGGFGLLILGVAMLRYGDKLLGKNPNRR